MNNKVGRPSKLNESTKTKLLQALRAGNTYEHACRYAGVTYSTFRNWMTKGEQSKSGEYFDFFEAIKAAESDAVVRMVAQWQSQMTNDWRAICAFLERRYPDDFGRRQAHTVSGPDGGAIRVTDESKNDVLRKLDAFLGLSDTPSVSENADGE